MAFVIDRSIITNSSHHIGNPELFKIDLKDFFSSINIQRVISIFRYLGYTKKVSYYLASICCLNSSLPQGAPTSPTLSNLAVKKLDKRLKGLCNRYGIAYTRYADDLAFSSIEIPRSFIKLVEENIHAEGFVVNEKKTNLSRKGQKKILTGISISSSDLKVPKKYSRKLRQEIFFIKKYGFAKHTKKLNINDPIYKERIIGRLYFWKMVEPNNQFVNDSIEEIRNIDF